MEQEISKGSYGLNQPLDEWLELNRSCASQRDVLEEKIAAFPPPELMQNVSGLTKPADFASHGSAYLAHWCTRARIQSSITEISSISAAVVVVWHGSLRGFRTVKLWDVDRRHVDWINQNLGFMTAVLTQPRAALPLSAEFDCVISISVFTHITEEDHWTYFGNSIESRCPARACSSLSTAGAPFTAHKGASDLRYTWHPTWRRWSCSFRTERGRLLLYFTAHGTSYLRKLSVWHHLYFGRVYTKKLRYFIFC